nr:immunoglobulin light chain junction region [Macaca mulatta]
DYYCSSYAGSNIGFF